MRVRCVNKKLYRKNEIVSLKDKYNTQNIVVSQPDNFPFSADICQTFRDLSRRMQIELSGFFESYHFYSTNYNEINLVYRFFFRSTRKNRFQFNYI
jgi:hypothetical protein